MMGVMASAASGQPTIDQEAHSRAERQEGLPKGRCRTLFALRQRASQHCLGPFQRTVWPETADQSNLIQSGFGTKYRILLGSLNPFENAFPLIVQSFL